MVDTLCTSIEKVNDLLVYFNIFVRTTDKYREISNVNFDNIHKLSVIYYEVIAGLFRIIPLKTIKSDNRVKLQSEGFVKVLNCCPSLKKKLADIVDNYNSDLLTLKTVRNKFEHEAHKVTESSSVGSAGEYDWKIGLVVNRKKLTLTVNSLFPVLVKLWEIFDIIRLEILAFAEKNEYIEYPVYTWLKEYKFTL